MLIILAFPALLSMKLQKERLPKTVTVSKNILFPVNTLKIYLHRYSINTD